MSTDGIRTEPLCSRCGGALTDGDSADVCVNCQISVTVDYTLPENSQPGVSIQVGNQIGPYRLKRLLGKGGMGRVYEAEHEVHGRRVALKMLNQRLTSEEHRKRFLREGRLAASLNHPNSVYIFGTDEIDGTPIIIMELAESGTLQDRVNSSGPLPIREAVDIVLQLIDGLEAAEQIGVLHRDIKPSNCFVDLDGSVKIGDFGLSISNVLRDDTRITKTGSLLGTPAFASPEQLRGDELDVRSDIYSLGVTLFYLLTGRIPFEANQTMQLLSKVLEQTAPSPGSFRPEVPDGLANAVLRCLKKSPRERYENYDRLRLALLPYSSQVSQEGLPGFRFFAIAVDVLILLSLETLIIYLFDWSILSWDITLHPDLELAELLAGLVYDVANFVVWATYFIIQEAKWSMTFGKKLFGLRVLQLDSSQPRVSQIILRSVIFSFFFNNGIILESAVWHLQLSFEEGSYIWFILEILYLSLLFFPALLFVSGRKRNHYAGLHEVFSKTRVFGNLALAKRISKASRYSTPVGSAPKPRHGIVQFSTLDVNSSEALARVSDSSTSGGEEHVGPYRLTGAGSVSACGSVRPGYDERLQRPVWIRTYSASNMLPDRSHRRVNRIGRLRWLQGSTGSDAVQWDAFAAPSGQPFLRLIGERKSWSEIKFWLKDLVNELSASLKDDTLPELLELDRIWITDQGRAILLDFSLINGNHRTYTTDSVDASRPDLNLDHAPEPTEVGKTSASSNSPGLFLKRVAIAALNGEPVLNEPLNETQLTVPLPVHVRNVLASLDKFEEGTIPAKELSASMNRPEHVSFGRRIGMASAALLSHLLFSVTAFIILFLTVAWIYRDTNPFLESQIQQDLRNTATGNLIKVAEYYETLPENDPLLRDLEVATIYHFTDYLAEEEAWHEFCSNGRFPDSTALWLNSLFHKKTELNSEEVMKSIKRVSDDSTEMAAIFSRELFDELHADKWYSVYGQIFGSLLFSAIWISFMALLFNLIQVTLINNLYILKLFEVDVVTVNGRRASRLRLLARSIILWLLVAFCLLMCLISMGTLYDMPRLITLHFASLFLLLILFGNLFLARRPLHDRLTGTWMVPY